MRRTIKGTPSKAWMTYPGPKYFDTFQVLARGWRTMTVEWYGYDWDGDMGKYVLTACSDLERSAIPCPTASAVAQSQMGLVLGLALVSFSPFGAIRVMREAERLPQNQFLAAEAALR